MSTRLRSAVAALVALTLLVGTAAAAHAAAPTPPYEPDPGSIGSLTFYDAGGNVITSGNINDAPFAAYVQASTAGRAGDSKATLFGYLPKNGVATGAWSGEALTASSTYPHPAAPAPLGTSPLPLVTLSTGDSTLASLVDDLPNTATDSYQGLYQLRLKTSGTSTAGSTYDSADILITGNTWTLVYPAPVATVTTTALSVSPSSPQTAGAAVTLTATVTPANAAGTVQFKDGAANIGAPVAVAGGSASTSTSSLGVATHSLTAVFTPTNPATFAPSTSPAVSYVVGAAPATPTSTALAVNTGAHTAFAPVGLTATVTPSGAAGTVTFKDGAITLGTSAAGSGTFTLTTSALDVGTHTVSATFNPTDPGTFTTSSVTGSPFTLDAPQFAAVADIQAEIAAGTLVISTPFTPAAPFDLGALALNQDGTQFAASKPFSGITVTDTRAGNLPWTVSAQASSLSNGGAGLINAQNLGLTQLVAVPVANNALTAASVVTTDNPAAVALAPDATGQLGLGGGVAHTVLHADHGTGSIGYGGLLTLTAPSSSPAGTYTGTITFTIG